MEGRKSSWDKMTPYLECFVWTSLHTHLSNLHTYPSFMPPAHTPPIALVVIMQSVKAAVSTLFCSPATLPSSPFYHLLPKQTQTFTHHLLPYKWMQHRRPLACCAGLGTIPPREITIEYCEKEDYTDYFIKLADGIENAFPDLVVLGNPDGIQSRKGSFEVKTGQTVLFSKLQTSRLPTVEEILEAINVLPPLCKEDATAS